MHIPDGFIAPQMYLPAYAAAAGAWAYGAKRFKRSIREENVPLLAVMTAFAFVLSLVALPMPGGTSAHALGAGLLSVLFGVWATYLAISFVLLLQALLFGMGGITSLPINALAIGLLGSASALSVFRLLGGRKRWALFAAGWMGVVLPALMVGAALGAQPWLSHRADGSPLFFPFGFRIAVPAVVLPHLAVGVGEGVLTALVYEFVTKMQARRL